MTATEYMIAVMLNNFQAVEYWSLGTHVFLIASWGFLDETFPCSSNALQHILFRWDAIG